MHPERLSDLRDFRVDLKWNYFSVLQRLKESDFIDGLANTSTNNGTLFFPGCTLLTYAPELAEKTFELLAKNDSAIATTKLCCGNPLLSVGLQEKSDLYAEKLLKRIQDNGFSRIITACSNCFRQFNRYIEMTGIDGISVEALPQVLVEMGVKIESSGEFATPVCTIHDPCPDRLDELFSANVRKLLGETTIQELTNNRRDTKCCGNGGVASYFNPALYMRRCADKLKSFKKASLVNANIVCACMACVHTFRYASPDIPAYHYLELLFDTKIDWLALKEYEGQAWGRSSSDPKNYKRLYEDISEVF
jgi:Fe-S oxidoreductase